MDTEEQDQIQQALNKAFFYLRFRFRTEKEVVDYLKKKAERYHWSSSVIEKTIQSLKESDFINDDTFVEWFVHSRSSGKPKSVFALKNELQKFGVDKDRVTAFFEENPVDEEDLALTALKERWSRYKILDKKERFQKAAAFLSRRGFGFDTIKKNIALLEEDPAI